MHQVKTLKKDLTLKPCEPIHTQPVKLLTYTTNSKVHT